MKYELVGRYTGKQYYIGFEPSCFRWLQKHCQKEIKKTYKNSLYVQKYNYHTDMPEPMWIRPIRD